MAERRMFAKTIVLSDAFLDMPMSARCLYFTFGMVSDDDGFVNNPRSIMRQIGASDDDARVLISKRFILAFDSGVIVIKHWRMNNYLRNDRYTETKYVDEKATLELDENGAYTEKNEVGIPGGIPSSGYPQVSIGKSKDSKGKSNKQYVESFDSFWSQYPKKVGKSECVKAWNRLKPSEELQAYIIADVLKRKKSDQWTKDNGQYIPNPLTYLKQKRWEDEVQTSKSNLERLAERFKDE